MKPVSRAVLVLAAALLAACAAFQGPQLALGQTEADVVAQLGPPSDRFAMPDGVQRLQWVTGPLGRQTWMVDIGPDGRSRWFAQVLTRAHLFEFAQRAQGMTIPQLLRELGRPAEQRRNGWGSGQTWSWRYVTYDCLWWQVSIDKDGKVTGAGEGIDPLCDVDDRPSLL
ncbi:MAG: hypothetical protein IT501_09875 [Rubrivivax sp.]|jgi:hypothetical protein|nr:hypothetical protein [Rubrivivax sp.]